MEIKKHSGNDAAGGIVKYSQLGNEAPVSRSGTIGPDHGLT